MAVIDPTTGKEFAPNVNPFEQGTTVTPEFGKIAQEDYAYSLRNSSPAVVQSTQGLRDGETLVKTNAADALTTIDTAQNTDLQTVLNAKPYGETDEGKARAAELEAARKGLGILSDTERTSIEQQANDAGLPYDQLIREAEQAKRQGLPIATVGAGERGGFMNTQFAGAAALAPTEGGNFIGAGGELERVQSVYDQNIQNAQANKQRAIAAARQAATIAARTGKKEDLTILQDMMDRARQANQDAITLAKEKVDAIAKVTEMKQNSEKYNMGKLQDIVTVGGQIPEQTKAYWDQVYGTGWTDKYVATNAAIKKATDQKSQLSALSDIYTLLDKVPESGSIQIGGSTYSGLKKEGDMAHGVETDDHGNVTEYTTKYNPTTKKRELVSVVSLGNIGKGKTAPSTAGKNSELNTKIKDLLQNARGQDLFIDSGKYGEVMDWAVSQGPTVVTQLMKQLPVETYLRPDDPGAKRFINTQSQAYTAGNGDELSAIISEAIKNAQTEK